MTPIWPQMTFDPSIALHFGQGFVLPKLEAIGKSWAIWLTPANPCMIFDPSVILHLCHGFFLPSLVVILVRKRKSIIWFERMIVFDIRQWLGIAHRADKHICWILLKRQTVFYLHLSEIMWKYACPASSHCKPCVFVMSLWTYYLHYS